MSVMVTVMLVHGRTPITEYCDAGAVALFTSRSQQLAAKTNAGRWWRLMDDRKYTLPERITHWPPPVIRPKPEWSRQPHFVTKYRIVSRLLDDVYGTLNAGLKVPTAVAARTVFDAASKELDVDPSKPFFQKLDELRNKGRIGEDERRTLDVLVDAGNAGAHRGWIPSTDQLDTILSILEEFLHRAFVLKQKADNLSKEIPPRHRRKKSS